MVYSLIGILLLTCTSVQASTCHLYLDLPQSSNWTSAYKKSVLRVHKIDEDLYKQLLETPQPSLIQAYISLKQKAWSVLPFGMVNWRSKNLITDFQFERWKYYFGTKYNFDLMTENQKVIFYANALQSIYGSLALQIKNQYLNSFVDLVLNLNSESRSQSFSESSDLKISLFKMLNFLFDKFVVYDLRRSELNPELIENIFLELDTSKESWIRFVLIFIDISKYKPSYTELETWDSFKNLSVYEKDLVRSTYSNYHNKVNNDLCCKSESGCLFCPNNLGFIIK